MFDTTPVRIECVNMAKLNKIRAWARKRNASVQVSRYARDAYEGRVNIASPWNKGKITVDAEIAELKALIAS